MPLDREIVDKREFFEVLAKTYCGILSQTDGRLGNWARFCSVI